MAKKRLVIEYEQTEHSLSDLKEHEVRLLRRVIEICKEAKAQGNNPFGCLLADKDGNILMEQGNEESSLNGDCTAHAESLLMRKASQKYSKEEMAGLTMYSCAEPCAMCAGAIVNARIPTVVYGCANPKAGCAGSILNVLNEPRFNHRAAVISGVMEEECARLLSEFFARKRL